MTITATTDAATEVWQPKPTTSMQESVQAPGPLRHRVSDRRIRGVSRRDGRGDVFRVHLSGCQAGRRGR